MKKIIVNLCRILVGALFIFSGFVKADDPLGFSYKLSEYFDAFGIEKFFPDPSSVYISMLICVFEMFVGICLLIGVFRNFSAWMSMLMIVFFGFLTFYTAYYHKVTECGCFGDAIPMTAWQSFGKNVILFILILPIFFNRNLINPIFPPRLARTVAISLLLASLLFTMYAYYFLPPIDFRPYAEGKDIKKEMETPPAPKDSVILTFIYQNKHTGKKVELTMDQLSRMDSAKANEFAKNDSFIDRKDVPVRHGLAKIFSFLLDDEPPKAPIHDFSIQNQDSDVTKSFLSEKGYRLMIVQYDVEKSAARFQPELNKLVMDLMKDGRVKIWPLSGSSAEMNAKFKKENGVPYSYYSADVTVLKTIVRSNPGLVLFHDNVVLHQWPATALPKASTVESYIK